MSKKSGTTPRLGGRISRASGGAGNGGGPSQSSSSPNLAGPGRDSHFKGMQTAAKYGMLLWQSKLQEKFLQEQKERKAKEQAEARRKSEEDYNYKRRGPLRAGSGQRRESSNINSNTNVGSANANNTDKTISLEPQLANPAMAQTPTDLSAKFGDRDHVHDLGAITTFPENKSFTPAREPLMPNDSHSHLKEGPIPNPNPNLSEAAATTLPKIGKVGPSSNPATGHYYHQIQNFKEPPQSNHVQYLSSPNLAFFGLGFGSGTGAGAPRRSPSGRVITNLQGHPEIRYHQKDTKGFDQTLRYMMDKERIAQYKEDLDNQVLENAKLGRVPIKIMSSHSHAFQPSNPGFDAVDYNYGRRTSRGGSNGMELAPLIRKYKSLPKLNSYLSSTDATKPSPRKGDFCLSPEPTEIAKGLEQQLAEKQKLLQIQQENERREAERHFNTWDTFWGRPGHGAPIFYRNPRIGASTPSLVASTGRSDLFQALHSTWKKGKT